MTSTRQSIRPPSLTVLGGAALAAFTLLAGAAGCGDSWANLIASLGGSRAGARGEVRLVFINNTPYRAVFTFGTYDHSNPDFAPDASQFLLEDTTLEGNDRTDVGALDCARVFSIGGPRLLDLIETNIDSEFDETAFVEGVDFYDADDDPPVRVGSAAPFEALLGVDFGCGSLLIVRFEGEGTNEVPFLVDFELIPSRSTR